MITGHCCVVSDMRGQRVFLATYDEVWSASCKKFTANCKGWLCMYIILGFSAVGRRGVDSISCWCIYVGLCIWLWRVASWSLVTFCSISEYTWRLWRVDPFLLLSFDQQKHQLLCLVSQSRFIFPSLITNHSCVLCTKLISDMRGHTVFPATCDEVYSDLVSSSLRTASDDYVHCFSTIFWCWKQERWFHFLLMFA